MAKDQQRYEKACKAGAHYLQVKNWEKALRAYRIAVDEFPKDPAAYAGLGEACLGMKQLDRALECYKLAARYSRGDVNYLAKVADIQERQGQLREAGRTYMAIGEIYLKMRRLDDAVDQWQRAIRLEPNLLGAHKRLAMVFQRKNNVKDAVRAYLAIARILQQQGENKKALRMCQAAARLDPDNEDVRTAMQLIQLGEQGFEEPEEEEAEAEQTAVPAEPDELAEVIRQMTAVFEAERQPVTAVAVDNSPAAVAHRAAHEALAAEIFREEDDDDNGDDAGLSKLERDALIGQGMDFENRGQQAEAISCYERAIRGGLKLPAAHYLLGALYLDAGRADAAKAMFRQAVSEPVYAKAVAIALKSK